MNNNFKLDKQNIGEEVELKGWVNKSRKLGDIIFLDIRNGEELVQVIIPVSSSVYDIAGELKNEYVVSIKGTVVERKNSNSEMRSGDIEIEATSIFIINKANILPMIINDKTDALEQKRLEYRYLDLRRNINQKMLKKRSNLNRLIRDYFYNNNFIEVETPIITKPTSGGAGEFKVISDNHKGKYYSLAQSPQIYKQLLMYSGVEKYFQIAKCFRDEDSRSDRQLEFSQLDFEISFSSQEEIMTLVFGLLKEIIKEFKGFEIKSINKISYQEAMNNYGSDKPDTRFENKIFDLTEILLDTSINYISSLIKNGKQAKAVFFEGEISNGEIKKIEELLKSQGASELFWVKITSEGISGSLKKLSNENIKDIKNKMNIFTNGMLFVIIDNNISSLEFIGRVRLLLANKLNIINKNKISLLWVTDFPLFKENSKGKIESMHNPFSSIKNDQKELLMNLDKDSKEEILKIYSNAFDIVFNGSEIGGGSMRINKYDEQTKIFKIIGMTSDEIKINFGWFLEAQKFGIPEHGGLALGIDRIISILLKKESLRDVIAFPKTSHGTDDMMKGPINLK